MILIVLFDLDRVGFFTGSFDWSISFTTGSTARNCNDNKQQRATTIQFTVNVSSTKYKSGIGRCYFLLYLCYGTASVPGSRQTTPGMVSSLNFIYITNYYISAIYWQTNYLYDLKKKKTQSKCTILLHFNHISILYEYIQCLNKFIWTNENFRNSFSDCSGHEDINKIMAEIPFQIAGIITQFPIYREHGDLLSIVLEKFSSAIFIGKRNLKNSFTVLLNYYITSTVLYSKRIGYPFPVIFLEGSQILDYETLGIWP